MKRETFAIGATLEDALDAALADLGVQQDAVGYELADESPSPQGAAGSRFEKGVRVRVWLTEEFIATRQVDADDDEGDQPEPSSPSAQGDTASSAVGGLLPTLSEEELDRIADEGVAIVQEVLGHLGIEADIEEYEGDEGEIILDIVGPDLGLLIGRHGRTLDSLQVVVSAIANRKIGFRYPVVIDVEGYRARRRERLEEIGQRSADRAVRQKAPVKLRPMSAQERRVLHMSLRDDRRVSTASEGEEPFRAVVITPNSR